jgi:two-component system, OmpR family, sensor kinase
MTLQRRVLGYLGLAAILSCALTVGVAAVLVRHRIASQRMSALEAQADLLAAASSAAGQVGLGDHVYRVGTGGPRRLGPARAALVLASIPASDPSNGTATIRGIGLIYAARATPSGRVVLVRSAKLAFSEWRPFLGSLILSGLGGALLALLLSYLLARRLTRPIGELARATRHLAAGETGVVVPASGDRELADLGGAFNDMSEQLAVARESQRRFLESVSHELKTPLTSIRGYAEALQEGAVAPSEGARVIRDEAGRLEQLVADLLELARFGRADFAVEHRPVALATIVDQAVARHLPMARELAVELSSSTDDAAVLADEGRLLQVTSNLIENALRLTPAGGAVTVHASSGQISVADTGPGLAAEDLPHAFERFYLYDRYRSERPVGSGLGLAIVKELVAAMGGTVEASRRASGGAAFVVRLPPAT